MLYLKAIIKSIFCQYQNEIVKIIFFFGSLTTEFKETDWQRGQGQTGDPKKTKKRIDCLKDKI
jgi:hypothetical protein